MYKIHKVINMWNQKNVENKVKEKVWKQKD